MLAMIEWMLGLFDDVRRATSFGEDVTAGLLGIGVWFALQLVFLRAGQTVGKRLVGIRVVDFGVGSRPSWTLSSNS